MSLVYSQAHQAYLFFFGDSPMRMGHEPMFFETRREAVYAAKTCGLRVTNRNTVKAMGGE